MERIQNDEIMNEAYAFDLPDEMRKKLKLPARAGAGSEEDSSKKRPIIPPLPGDDSVKTFTAARQAKKARVDIAPPGTMGNEFESTTGGTTATTKATARLADTGEDDEIIIMKDNERKPPAKEQQEGTKKVGFVEERKNKEALEDETTMQEYDGFDELSAISSLQTRLSTMEKTVSNLDEKFTENFAQLFVMLREQRDAGGGQGPAGGNK
jgi:hypothetical protein